MNERNRILIVDDEPDIRARLEDILDDEGYEVDAADSALQAMERKSAFTPDLVLLDIWMPEMDGVSLLKHWNDRQELTCPVVMMSGHGTVETAVEATRHGAYDFIEKPLSMAKLIRVVKSALTSGVSDNAAVPQRLEEPVGNSQIVQTLRQTMQELAQHSAPVFLTGQSSTDLAIWAGYLFNLKPRPLPVRNFGSDLQDLSQAGNSNVFIDEITDLNGHSQQILLNLLRQVKNPLSNSRIVVASQYDFQSLRQASEILPELAEYWRDAIHIPSLDEHIEDIPELLEYYVNWYADEEQLPYRHFGVAAQNLIRNHRWAGGLEDLKLVIHHLLANDDAEQVELDEIRHVLEHTPRAEVASVAEVQGNQLDLHIDLELDMREAREVFEREYLRTQLTLCNNNVSELARKIGLERTNLYRKLKTLGLHGRK